MRSLDRATIEAGTSGEVLMERAGTAAYAEMRAYLDQCVAPQHCARILVVAGKGNNGGDGYVVARCFAQETQLSVSVCAVCPPAALTGAAKMHAEQLPATVSVTVCSELPDTVLAPGTIIVDALLGTGVSGPLRAPYDRLISQINSSGLPVMALDIPSGLDGDTGATATETVNADLTVTMAFAKTGMLTANGLRHCGLLRCVDIGIPRELTGPVPASVEAVFAADIRQLFARQPRDSHKGTFGTLVVLGGSELYAGAPVLAGVAGLRSGTGLVIVGMPDKARGFARAGCDALILQSIPGTNGVFGPNSNKTVDVLLDRASAIVFGPGIGRRSENLSVLQQILATDLPVVLDADALRLLASDPSLLPRSAPTVLTPHPGEMRCLLDTLGIGPPVSTSDNRLQQATEVAQRTQTVTVLKGLGTVVADPTNRCTVNTTGTCALSSAGTGDVLAGMIGGFLAQGMPASDAARAAVYLHGAAAELAPHGMRSMVADDLLTLIGPAMQRLTPFA